jgi:ferredoxin
MSTLTINGQSIEVSVEPDTPLLWVIREQVGLTGTKYGCGVAVCGACSVHINGEVQRACSIPVSAIKESDRIDAMARGLEACGVTVEEDRDVLIVHGMGPGGVPGGATCATRLDHRIAMSFLVLGLAAKRPVSIDDGAPLATSFPMFEPLMRGLGAAISRDAA